MWRDCERLSRKGVAAKRGKNEVRKEAPTRLHLQAWHVLVRSIPARRTGNTGGRFEAGGKTATGCEAVPVFRPLQIEKRCSANFGLLRPFNEGRCSDESTMPVAEYIDRYLLPYRKPN